MQAKICPPGILSFYFLPPRMISIPIEWLPSFLQIPAVFKWLISLKIGKNLAKLTDKTIQISEYCDHKLENKNYMKHTIRIYR